MIVIGIDENGLGPLLGPLIVTATAFSASEYDADYFWQLAGDDLPADDSKALFSRRRPGPGEDAFLQWLSLFNKTPQNYRELIRSVCTPFSTLSPCKVPVPDPCIPSKSLTIPVWSKSPAPTIPPQIQNRFIQNKIEAKDVKSLSICPGLFNKLLDKPDMNKFRLDFELMIHLVRYFKKSFFPKNLHVICGKVGSTKSYGPWFKQADITDYHVELESREESTYIIPNLGHISFIKDADAKHLPVAVASMIGKYLRELAMLQLNQMLRPSGREASGYRDKVTQQFVKDTVSIRQHYEMEDSCFLRNS